MKKSRRTVVAAFTVASFFANTSGSLIWSQAVKPVLSDTQPGPGDVLIPEATAPAPVLTAAPEGAAQPSDSASSPKTMMGVGALMESLSTEPIDFNFQDDDLLGIFRTFSVKFNKNIITAPGVGGKVTLHLHGIPFDEAFQTLLDEKGLIAVQKSANVIEIIRSADMPILSQVFNLKYRFATELALTLTNMLRTKGGSVPENAVIVSDASSNALIVTAKNDVLHKIKTIVDQLDIKAPQISIKVRLIEAEAGKTLAWSPSYSATALSRNGLATRLTLDAQNFTPQQAQSQTALNTSVWTLPPLTTQRAPSGFPLGGLFEISSIMNNTQLYGLLNLLATDLKTKTISEPTIMTGNNKSADIHVGENLPVVTSQVTQTATTQSVQYIPEGVDLEVTPIVSPGSDIISVKIRVNVSDLVGFQQNNPITSERVAITEVAIESGKTVVIGGLLKDTSSESTSGVPILKDIPLLGWLFKTKNKSKDKTELLIFITPELVKGA